MNARSRRSGGNRGTSRNVNPAEDAPSSAPRPTTPTATRPSIPRPRATAGWISPTTPTGRSAASTCAERPGWNGPGGDRRASTRPRRAPRRASPPRPWRGARRAREPRSSHALGRGSGEHEPRLAVFGERVGPAEGDPHLEQRDAAPAQRLVPGRGAEQPRREPCPEEPLLLPQRVRHGDGIAVFEEIEVLLGRERHRPDLAQSGAHEGVLGAAGERVRGGHAARLRRPRPGRADPLVALDPDDLLDEVDLALDVGAVPGHLDLDRVTASPDAASRGRRRRRRRPARSPRSRGAASPGRGARPPSVAPGPTPRPRTPAATRAPVHSPIKAAQRVAASSTASGSVPRSKRYDASEWRPSRRAVSSTPPRVNDADSSSTSVVVSPTSVDRPPITPAIATGRSTSQMNRSSGVSDRSSSSRVVSRSPSPASRTTIPGPASRSRSKPCMGWPRSSIT